MLLFVFILFTSQEFGSGLPRESLPPLFVSLVVLLDVNGKRVSGADTVGVMAAQYYAPPSSVTSNGKQAILSGRTVKLNKNESLPPHQEQGKLRIGICGCLLVSKGCDTAFC